MGTITDIVQHLGPGVYGITGSAGSGKTTLSSSLNYTIYSIDTRFIGDSQVRKDLLQKKQSQSIDDYMDAVNQFNWWNWDAVLKDLLVLTKRQDITIKKAYNRDTGKVETKTIE